jgi:hypothetical protein
MELTSEDAALLLIASEDIQLKLKKERSGVHEINQLREQYGEYHHLFPQLKADSRSGFIQRQALLKGTLPVVTEDCVMTRPRPATTVANQLRQHSRCHSQQCVSCKNVYLRFAQVNVFARNFLLFGSSSPAYSEDGGKSF